MNLILPICALVAAVTLSPGPATAADPAADTTAVVAVADPPGPSGELADLTRALRAAVAERTRGVLGADEIRQRMAGHVSTASLSELDRAYSGAVAANQSGDYEGSARTLRAVIEDLQRLPESEDGFAQWRRAMLRLARVEGSLGRKGEAHDVMDRLLRADPTVRADPDLYPPSFQKQLDEVRTALQAGPKRKLQVTAGGRPVRVFVEGRQVGQAPATLSLPPGRYRVNGAVGEVHVSGGVADLTQEDATVALDFGVAERFRPDAGPGLAVEASGRPKAIVTAGASLKLDRILAASIETQGDVRFLGGALYDVRRGMLLREAKLRLVGQTPPSGGLAALATFLLTGEGSALVITKPDLTARPSTILAPIPEGPRTSRVMGWSALGAGALAVGLAGFATYEGISSSRSYSDANGMRNPDGTLKPGFTINQYNAKVGNGDDAKRTAWISGGAAVVSAAVSGVLGYINYQRTGEIGIFRF
jgi:hypothetical protein